MQVSKADDKIVLSSDRAVEDRPQRQSHSEPRQPAPLKFDVSPIKSIPSPQAQTSRPSSPVTGQSPVISKSSTAKIGPYILGKTLGVGSTGRVKIATHIETGQKAAVKIIPKQSLKPKKTERSEIASDPSKEEAIINKKLEREIAIMKLIQHPSIMGLYDVYESPEELYLVLELVEGGELFDYLVKQGRLRELEALDFFQQIVAGIDYCHKHLICHRDLKPENLLLDGQRHIKIADFGMASLQVQGKLLETSCGSPHYASPEIIRGVKYDGSLADVWSCGVILYALLTGNLPFDDDNIRRLLQRVKAGVYVIPDYVPKDAADLIRKMLVVDPQKRITVADIEKHPWFTKIPYKWKNGGEGPLRTPPSQDAIQPYAGSISELDEDILNSLSILGYGTFTEIYASLQSKERNYEKVFYWALKQRKNEFLEKYDNEYDDHSRSLHRRTGSRSSVFTDRGSMIGSMDLTSTGTNTAPVSQTNRKSDLPVQEPEENIPRKRTTSEAKRKSYNPSPLSVRVDESEQSVDEARQKALQALTGNRPQSPMGDLPTFSISSNARASGTSGKKTSIIDQFKKQISLTDNNGPAHSSMISLRSQVPPNNKTAISSDAVKPVQLIDQKLALNTAISASSPSIVANGNWNNNLPSSPAVSSAPKRSWFANLFQFKPESFVMYSSLTLDKTKTRIEEYLQELDVQYQQSKDGISLKCKFDSSNTLPAVKFRISLNYAEDDRIEIMTIQQQGALSTFQVFIDKFKLCIE